MINNSYHFSFLLKKFISALLLPLPISIFLLIFGIVMSFRFLKSGLTMILVSFLILLLSSTHYLPNILLAHLESQFPPLIEVPKNVRTIVVLGAGLGGNPQFPANTRLDAASLSRLIEGLRLYQQLKNQGIQARLILSGGRVFGPKNQKSPLENTAVMLGVPEEDINIENGSLDTYEETIFLKPLVKNETFILVTSAAHMARAFALFKKAGMNPIAAPTEFLTERNKIFKFYLPSSSSLINTDIALHEYYGIAWAKIKRMI